MESLFFVALLPPASISTDIDQIRKQCSLDYKVYAALKPPVHITLIPPFKIDPTLEGKLISDLECCRNFSAFEQELHNYDGFPKKVIYIKAIKNVGITQLYKILKTTVKPYISDLGSIVPHITIAYRDVDEHAYEKIIEAYNKKRFQASFSVHKFTLLKHDGKKWNLFKEFESRPSGKQFSMDF